MLGSVGNWANKRWSWGVLFGSALVLELVALFFQYGMDLKPCIMCIYQRAAVFGVMFAALIPLIANTVLTRLIAYIGWGVSAIWGLLIALEHVDIQTAINPFFVTCEFVPNFPSFMPLHEWLPKLFAATGDCGDIDWQFLGYSMPQWMVVIFGIYSALLVFVLITRLVDKKGL